MFGTLISRPMMVLDQLSVECFKAPLKLMHKIQHKQLMFMFRSKMIYLPPHLSVIFITMPTGTTEGAMKSHAIRSQSSLYRALELLPASASTMIKSTIEFPRRCQLYQKFILVSPQDSLRSGT